MGVHCTNLGGVIVYVEPPTRLELWLYTVTLVERMDNFWGSKLL